MPAPATAQKTIEDAWHEMPPYTLAPGEEYEQSPVRVNPAGRTIRGWVGDEQQNAVAGAKILATSRRECAESGADGHFELCGLPMRDTVWIVAVHPTKRLYRAVELDPDWGFEPGLILGPLGKATGRVQDLAGIAVPDLKITAARKAVFEYTVEPLLSPSTIQSTTQTDAHGNFSIEGLIGGMEYSIWGHDEDRGLIFHTDVLAQPGETVQLGTITTKKRNVP